MHVTRCQESVASFFPLNYFSKNATFSKKRERRKRQFSHIALQKVQFGALHRYTRNKKASSFPSQCYSTSLISSVIQPAVCPELFHQLCFQLPVVYRYRLANWFDKNILIIFVAQVLRFFLKKA